MKTGVENDIFWSEIGSGFGGKGSTLPPLSPPQRLLLGIHIKIAIIEKIESARGTIVPRTLPFFFSPASPQHKEASVEERAPSKNSQEYPPGFRPHYFQSSKKKFKDFSRACKEIQVLFSKKFKDFSRLCESCLKKLGAKMVELSKVHH